MADSKQEQKSGDTVQKVKDKLSIVDVVSPYVKLTKAGKYLRGLSPFTKEKTPSFFVNVDRGSYYCFSTSQGGDIFTFIEKMEGVDFKGALKILAEKAGVEIVYNANTQQERNRSERLREAMAEATQFYAIQLGSFVQGASATNDMPRAAALAYAKKRGLTDEAIATWSLGYAPDTWRALLEHLQAKGFSNQELVAAGLIKEAEGRSGTWYDRFRHRLMFPIRDSAGRTIAFTGRALAADDQAKYLNSPETELFHKSEVLFGMDRAKDAIRTRDFAILVEGQFDLLLLHQIGFQNTIALSGTALSPRHLSTIKRYSENLMLCLDADRAGLAASAKNAAAALEAGMRVKAVRLPAGKDPADLASESPKDFTKLIGEAQSIVEFFLSVLAASEHDSHKLVMAAEKTVIPLIGVIQSPLEQEHFVGVTARTLGLTPEAVRASIARVRNLSTESRQNPGAPKEGYAGPQGNAPWQRGGSPQQVNSAGTRGASGGASRNESRVSAVLSSVASTAARRGEFLLAVAETYADKPLAETLKNEYTRIIGSVPGTEVPAEQQQISERVLFEAGITFAEPPTDAELSELIRVFEQTFLREKLTEATNGLRRAELQGDKEATAAFAQQYKDLSAHLSALH